MHIHATSIRITHDDRSSKSRRADPLERLNRPNRVPMHPVQRARHGACRRRGPCLQQWPQRHDNDRLVAAVDLCVDLCGRRRRRTSSAGTAAEEPRKRLWHLPGMRGNALRHREDSGGARLAAAHRFRADHGSEASRREARSWVEGRLKGGPRTSRAAEKVFEIAKMMGKSNSVKERTCKGPQRLPPSQHRVGDEPGAAAIAGAMTGASASERPAKQVSGCVRSHGASGRWKHTQMR